MPLMERVKPLEIEEINFLIELMEECSLCISIDCYSILNLGYKFLPENAKQEYLFIREIADTNLNKTNIPISNVSLDYLAIVYNTTVATQKNVISKLIECNLITQTKEGYIVYNPLIEETFRNTILKILYRKELLSAASYIPTCNNPKERVATLNKLKNLISIKDEFPTVYEIIKNKLTSF